MNNEDKVLPVLLIELSTPKRITFLISLNQITLFILKSTQYNFIPANNQSPLLIVFDYNQIDLLRIGVLEEISFNCIDGVIVLEGNEVTVSLGGDKEDVITYYFELFDDVLLFIETCEFFIHFFLADH